jgi:hypothetical protein
MSALRPRWNIDAQPGTMQVSRTSNNSSRVAPRRIARLHVGHQPGLLAAAERQQRDGHELAF